MNLGLLKEMTLDQVRQFDPEVVIWPIGSVEPHGSTLPYGTDCYQVEGVVFRAVKMANLQNARVLIYPTQQISCNANVQGFPFACRMAPMTFVRLVLDVIEALEKDGIRKIVVFNGHGGNTDTLKMALREYSHCKGLKPGPFVCMAEAQYDPAIIEHRSIHGGESEVSRMMYLQPELVKTGTFHEQPFGQVLIRFLEEPKVHFIKPWHGFVPESAGGDTRKSSAEKGRAIIEQATQNLCDLLIEISLSEMKENFPYS